jgi:predicted lipoprotein
LFDDLKNQKLIKDYRNFGVCFNLVLNMEISNYLEKESLFYKNGMHMGIWNSNRNGVLVMIPITAKTDYFDSLKNKLISVLNETNSNR